MYYWIHNINNNPLPQIKFIKDLGIILSSSLSYSGHAQSMKVKASSTLGFNITKYARLYMCQVYKIIILCSRPFYTWLWVYFLIPKSGCLDN